MIPREATGTEIQIPNLRGRFAFVNERGLTITVRAERYFRCGHDARGIPFWCYLFRGNEIKIICTEDPLASIPPDTSIANIAFEKLIPTLQAVAEEFGIVDPNPTPSASDKREKILNQFMLAVMKAQFRKDDLKSSKKRQGDVITKLKVLQHKREEASSGNKDSIPEQERLSEDAVEERPIKRPRRGRPSRQDVKDGIIRNDRGGWRQQNISTRSRNILRAAAHSSRIRSTDTTTDEVDEEKPNTEDGRKTRRTPEGNSAMECIKHEELSNSCAICGSENHSVWECFGED